MNTPVSLEIDRLLIKRSIDMPVSPTIADVVMGLYEKYKIWINVTSDYNRFLTWQYRITSRNKTIGKDGIIYNEGFNSPTKAYEAAIEYTLKNLV